MIPARQSTAKTIIVGQVLDSTGAIVTDSVVGNFEGSVNGGDPAALNGSATLTHRGQGFYSLALTATDLATVGTFQVTINDGSDACPKETLVVMEEAIYDALFAASANGFAGAAGSSTVTFSNTTIATATAVTTVNGLANNVITAASIATGAIDADAIADNAIDAGAIANGAIDAATFAANALDAVWSTAARTLTAATNITDSGNAILMTDSGFVRSDFSSMNDEEVSLTPELAANFFIFFNNAAGVSSLTLDTVSTLTAGAAADAVWDEAIAGHLTAGSTGAALNAAGSAGDPWTTTLPGAYTGSQAGKILADVLADTAEIGAAGAGLTAVTTQVWAAGTRTLTAGTNIVLAKGTGVTGFNDLSAAQVNAEVDSSIETYHLDHLFQTTYDPASKPGAADALLNELVQNDGGVAQFTANALELAGGSGLTLQDVVNGVWDEPLAGHLDSGSTGAGLNAAGSAGDPWATALPGSYGSGTAGNIIGNRLDAAITSRMATYTQPTGFLAATFPTTVASTTNITAGTITTVTNLTNAPTAGDFTATMKTSIGTAVAASAVASVTGNVGGNVVGSVGSVTGLTASNLDATVSSRLASASYTAPPSAASIASTILAAGDVDGYSLEQTLKLCLAALAGKLSGAATTTITIRSADDSANRMVATVDADGNRTAITLNAAG